MNYKIIAYILSKIVFSVCAFTIFPLIFGIYEGNHNYLPFLEVLIFSILLGGGLYYYSREPMLTMNVREGIAITALSWLVCVFISMLPFWLGGYLSLIDSFFEASSGLGCMGATVIADLDSLPKSILLWRMLFQWIGGLGVIVVFIALLPQFGHGFINMMNAESQLGTNRVVPRLKEMAKELFKVYMIFTAISTTIFYFCGLTLFDALLHSFSTVATGGFSTHNASVGHFNNVILEIWMILFMFLCSLNFGLYVSALRHGIKVVLRSVEVKAYFFLLLISIILVTANLILQRDMTFFEALRGASFHVVSFSTSTGFSIGPFDTYPEFSHFCLLFLMLIGGCVGSTAGGLKLTRVLVLLKEVKMLFLELLHPSMGRSQAKKLQYESVEKFLTAGRFFLVYVLFCIFFSLLLMLDNLSPWDAIGASFSAMSCIGAAFGAVSSTFGELSNFSKIVISFAVLLGRLEIFTILALFHPDFWKKNKGW